MIPIQPVPTSYTLGQAEGPDGKFLVITFYDPTGQKSIFFPPDAAEKLADNIKEVVPNLKSSLEVVRKAGNLIVPGGQQ